MVEKKTMKRENHIFTNVHILMIATVHVFVGSGIERPVINTLMINDAND